MFLILNMFSKIGNLEFTNLHLIYDLETTGQIKMFTSNNKIRCQPRVNSYQKNNIYINEIYPEITEIAIKDYDTEMIILSTLVKPNSKISDEISKITGITNKMVKKQPSIDEIVTILESATNHFRDCKMMAHNGNRFDNKILLHYKMINPKNISFIDTMSIIPIHITGNIKLVKKSLGHIYYFLFKTNFKAHRAMNDVDALIKIMKHLKIRF
ncbi:MAG: 3'-5' exonuclease [Rickettsiales bacterium]|nr:MAG: 3'-5' exonuclease [Rickettsiales bacterium]